MRLGVVILGASVYDHDPKNNNFRFANSAKAFAQLFHNHEDFIEDCQSEVLDLYDKPLDKGDLIKRIADFINLKNFDDLILYYCGHGIPPTPRRPYSVLLRTTHPDYVSNTALSFQGLIDDLEACLFRKKVFVVIDSVLLRCRAF